MMNLEKLEKVDLRDVWKHEALDFTNWLSRPENLSLLSDELDIEISLVQTEASVGKFSVDILAEEEVTKRKIIIENQLETSDHDHLGKIITYASGWDAEIIVWIVRELRDEHKSAIDWLNEHTDEKLNFFIVKMEVWQIGPSRAPKFHVISQPNEWAKVVKHGAGQPTKLTEQKLVQLDFWESFREFVAKSDSTVRLRKPYPQHWYDISIGNSYAFVSLTVNSRKSQIECGMYIPDSKDLFHKLLLRRDLIEREIGETLDWQELPHRKAARIRVYAEGNISENAQWNNYFSWLLAETKKFQIVFSKHIAEITN